MRPRSTSSSWRPPTSWAAEQADDLRRVLRAGINAISLAEELADVEAQHPQLARELDDLARAHEVSLVGVGVNPDSCLTCSLSP